jgi:hypothetical protein
MLLDNLLYDNINVKCDINVKRWLVKESIVIEYRVSYCKILKSIGVSISNTGYGVSEYRISNTEKSIGCPALLKFPWAKVHKIRFSLLWAATCDSSFYSLEMLGKLRLKYANMGIPHFCADFKNVNLP